MTGALIVAALVLIVGIPFTLIWWRIADNWADEEHKRFKTKAPTGPGPRVVRAADFASGTTSAPAAPPRPATPTTTPTATPAGAPRDTLRP